MGARRILVIEDDAVFANALGELVRHFGHEPTTAARGDIGLVLARDTRPDAIVLDLRLPGIDGWVLLDRLKHHPATASIPVCVLTGDPRRLRALRLGAFAYVQKPVANETFGEVLREVDKFLSRAERHVAVVDDDPTRAAEIEAAIGDPRVLVSTFSSCEHFATSATSAFDACVVSSDIGAIDPVALRAMSGRLAPRGVPMLLRAEGEAANARVMELQRHAHDAYIEAWPTADHLVALVARALHRSPQAASQRRVPRAYDAALAGKSVLVIDDDARNILALTGLAEQRRMNVIAARGGSEAIDILKTARAVDLILSDIMMPEMDGFATMRAIRKLPGYERTPIVAVTAKAMKGDREACVGAGASDFVPKPVDAEQLCSVMRVLLAG